MDQQFAYVPTPPAPKREYTAAECVYAWLCLLSGYLFCRVFSVTEHPFGGFLFLLLFYAAGLAVLLVRGTRITGMPLAVLISGLVLLLSLPFFSGAVLHFFSYLYSGAALLYVIYGASGNCLEPGFSDSILPDFLRTLFVFPFRSFSCVFPAAGGHGKKGGRTLLKILLGAALAVIPTVTVCLLLSYDEGFQRIMDSIFSFEDADIGGHLLSVIFGIPIGMYFFGLYSSATEASPAPRPDGLARREKRQVLSTATVLTASLPVLAVYVIFFVSQWQYYVSAFTGVLPEGLSYADYARSGFFELCAVAVVNFVILAVVGLFAKRESRGQCIAVKVVSLLFAAASLILISTALSKMLLYIGAYGLTQLRVYTTWMMLVMTLIFLLIIVKQFVPKLKLIALSAAICVGAFALLVWSGTDGNIAKYNVDRYIDGSLYRFDAYTLYELDEEAVPHMVRLAKFLDEKNGTDIREGEFGVNYENDYEELGYYLRCTAQWLHEEKNDIWSFTLPRQRAIRALNSIGLWE